MRCRVNAVRSMVFQPAVNLLLHCSANLQQFLIAGRKAVYRVIEPVPERLCGKAGRRQKLVFNECGQIC